MRPPKPWCSFAKGVALQPEPAVLFYDRGLFVFARRKANTEADFRELPNSLTVGQGTTDKGLAYSYTDRDVPAGILLYRLQQVALEGTSSLTKPVQTSVVPGADDVRPFAIVLKQDYPNPFSPATIIVTTVPERSRARLAVYSLAGRELVRS